MKKQEIPIFFTIDDSYAPYMATALHSLIVNASKDYLYSIYIIHEKLSKENQKKIKAQEQEGFEIHFVTMEHGLENIQNRSENFLRCDYFTLTIYYRIFLSDMFPQYDKGLYLDSDIVIPGDISQLYLTDIGNNLIGACPDFSIQTVRELNIYIEKGMGISRYDYINSGILVLNMKELRKAHFSEEFLRLLTTYHFDCVAPDQDYFNAMCYGKVHFLDECWDAMPNNDRAQLKNPKLIHYNLFEKPWCYDHIQYEDYFWKYAKDSGYYDEILDFKASYSKEQKQSDAASLKRLFHKAETVPDTDVTFKKVYESGEKVRL